MRLRSLPLRARLLPPWVLWGVLTLLTVIVAARAYWLFWPRPISLRSVTLEFAPMGRLDGELLRDIAERTAQVYGVPYRLATEATQLPDGALEQRTRKYRADALLEELKHRRPGRGVHRLGITEADVSIEDWNFVFGLAEMPGSTAVMSLAKLRPRRPSRESDALLRQRAVKIAVHELGHTFGLRHCPDERCVMSYTETAAGVDRTGETFCAKCRSRLRR
jgi:archaemetzincin